ncbi:MAG: ABC transporter substrate-binding protein [bacterium]
MKAVKSVKGLRLALQWMVIAGCLLAGAGSGRALAATPVAILVRDSLTSTERCLTGIKKVITREHSEVTFHTFHILDDPGQNLRVLDSMTAVGPRLILTIGSSATQFAKEKFRDVPIVFASVKYPVLSGFVESLEKPGGNISGASLNIPVDIQFRYFHQVVPDLKRVGVLYTEDTKSLMTQAKVVAGEVGLELIPVLVEDMKQLPEALDSIARSCDGMWSVADPKLFDPRSTKFILLNTIRKSLPLMGFSRHVVESGALFALDFDYKAIGFQAGAVANRILAGENPAGIPVTQVDALWFHYNEKTAQHINIVMPEELVAIAKEVYR